MILNTAISDHLRPRATCESRSPPKGPSSVQKNVLILPPFGGRGLCGFAEQDVDVCSSGRTRFGCAVFTNQNLCGNVNPPHSSAFLDFPCMVFNSLPAAVAAPSLRAEFRISYIRFLRRREESERAREREREREREGERERERDDVERERRCSSSGNFKASPRVERSSQGKFTKGLCSDRCLIGKHGHIAMYNLLMSQMLNTNRQILRCRKRLPRCLHLCAKCQMARPDSHALK